MNNLEPTHLLLLLVLCCLGVVFVAWSIVAASEREEQQSTRDALETLQAERGRHAWIAVNEAHLVCTCGATATWLPTTYPAEYPDDTGLTRWRWIYTAEVGKVDDSAARFHGITHFV